MKQYQVIYCDPPWYYGSRISRGAGTRTRFGNGAEGHYDLMRDKELLAMAPQIKAITAEQAMCFMWATKPRLDFAIELLKAWGFQYATTPFVWVKVTQAAREAYEREKSRLTWEEYLAIFARKGIGSYSNDSTEFVICGRKGKMLPKRFNLPDGTIFTPVQEHSRKPDIVRTTIEDWIDAETRIELFCRHPAPGWDAFGNALDGRDIREALEEVSA